MTNKTTKQSRVNYKLCSLMFVSLFILTQCARDDSRSRQPARAQPQRQVQQQRYPQQYQPAQQQYYGVPNSQAYSNPYDFTPPYGQVPSDNDQVYVLPNEYILR